jgi:cytochrome c oxidase subunit II
MKRIAALIVVAVVALVPLFAKDVYLPITGAVGTFKTDARLVNPSGTKDITVVATFEPVNGSTVGTKTATIVIPKRQQRVYDDIVSTLFSGASGLGAIRLTSDDDFIATARIYSSVSGGTAGQGYTGIDVSNAKAKGIFQQLKSTGVSGQTGTFRSNLGFVNPSSTSASVVLRLYDRNSVKVNEQSISVPARGSLGPSNYFGSVSGDFTDAWASFTSSVPIIGYASILDNGTTDPTFLYAVEDSGSDVVGPSTKTFEIDARRFDFVVTPASGAVGDIRVKQGDRVKLRVTASDTVHGIGFIGNVFIPVPATLAPGQTREFEFTADRTGTFEYFCSVSCGEGHGTMDGRLIIEP